MHNRNDYRFSQGGGEGASDDLSLPWTKVFFFAPRNVFNFSFLVNYKIDEVLVIRSLRSVNNG